MKTLFLDAAAGAAAGAAAAASAAASAVCIYYVVIGGRFAPPYKYIVKYIQQKQQQKKQQQLQQQLQQLQVHYGKTQVPLATGTLTWLREVRIKYFDRFPSCFHYFPSILTAFQIF